MRRYLPLALATSVALVALPACLAGPTVTPIMSQNLPESANSRLPGTAQKLGLQTPNVGLKADEFQIQGAKGEGLAGADVFIDDSRISTGPGGVFKIPQHILEKGERIIATVKHKGMVPLRKRIMPGYALGMQPIDPTISAITATQGGTAVNNDGNLRVTFAPGALDRDAKVRVTRQNYNGPPSLEAVHPSFASLDEAGQEELAHEAYGYHLDLGGAQIVPGASVVLTFKLDPESEALLDHLDKQGMLENPKYGPLLVRDADGKFVMRLHSSAPEAANPVTPALAGLYSLLGATCNTVTDKETYTTYDWVTRPVGACKLYQFCWGKCTASYYLASEPNTWGNIILNKKYSGTWTSNGKNVSSPFAGTHWNVTTSGGCTPWPTVSLFTQTTATRDWTSSTINALVRYRSNDPRIHGQAVGGALVSFSHVGTPVRAATSSAYTASDGYASGWGSQGAAGTATASYAAEPFTWGTSANYVVNCSTVYLGIVKNMGQLNLNFNHTGTPITAALSLPSSHGAIALTALENQTLTLPHNNTASVTETVAINGGNWRLGDYELDLNPSAATLSWNATQNLFLTTWHNARITANLRYRSNDATVPADQQPTIKWNGQPVSGASLNFAHPVSTSGMKPAGRDQLSFATVNESQTTWGIRGERTTVTANLGVNGVNLSGTNSSIIDNTSVTVPVNANLPTITIPFSGTFDKPVVVSYALDGGETRTILLPAPTSSALTFYLPVEDALNVPEVHTLRLKSIGSTDLSRVFTMPDGSFSYPDVTGLQRGRPDTLYPVTLEATTNAPK